MYTHSGERGLIPLYIWFPLFDIPFLWFCWSTSKFAVNYHHYTSEKGGSQTTDTFPKPVPLNKDSYQGRKENNLRVPLEGSENPRKCWILVLLQGLKLPFQHLFGAIVTGIFWTVKKLGISPFFLNSSLIVNLPPFL